MRKSWIDTLWVLVINGLQVITMAVLFIRIANILGPANYGIFTFSMSVGMFAVLFDGFGGEYLVVMFGSRDEKNIPELFGNALILRLLLFLPILAVSYIVALCYQLSSHNTLAYMGIVSTSMMAGFASPFFVSYYRVVGKIRVPWLVMLSCKLLFLAYLTLLPREQAPIGHVVMGYFFSNFVLVLIFSVDLCRNLKIRLDLKYFLGNIKFNKYFFFSQIVDLLSVRVDVFAIQALSGASALGLYSLGYKIAGILVAIPSAIHMVMLPHFHKNANNHELLMKLFRQTRRVMIEVSAFVLGFLVYNGIRPFSTFIADEYQQSSIIVSIISVCSIVNFIAYPYAMLAEAENKIKQKLYARIWSLVFTIFIIYPLILCFGNAGAAVSVSCGMLCFLLLLHFKINDIQEKVNDILIELLPFAITVLAAFVEYLLRQYFPSGLIGSVVSVAVYSVVFFCWLVV